MKISNRKLVENIALIRQVSEKQLPVKASYTIAHNVDHMESVLRVYDKERQKLLDKYGEKDDKGKLALRPDGISVKFRDDPAEAAWKKDIEILLDIDNDIDIRKFKLSDLGNVNFSAAEMGAVAYMIEE